MPFHRSTARIAVVLSLLLGALLTDWPPAGAAFHQMKVREVYAGSVSVPAADFVELQMWAPGQNFVAGHRVHFYSLDPYGGATDLDCTIPSNVGGGANQSRILLATAEAQTAFGVTGDFTMPASLHADAGAVCFEGIDCVAWGSWSGPTAGFTGTPEAAIPADQSIERRTDVSGDPNQLEDADDTNDSANDFAPNAAPVPQGNLGPNLGSLTCQAIGGGGPGPGAAYSLQDLTARARGRKARISGRIDPPAPGRPVKLTFFANGSPLHRVGRATVNLNSDSRFLKKFRIPLESTRCKVIVRFDGDRLGQKRFRC